MKRTFTLDLEAMVGIIECMVFWHQRAKELEKELEEREE